MINKENLAYFETIIEELLGVLDSHKVSIEDGALITESLYIMSLSYLREKCEPNDLAQTGAVSFEAKTMGGIIPHNMVGAGRGWGIDSALLDEEN